MTDFHSHILPNIDDGSSSVEESLELLAMLSSQGIDTVVATPHFHPAYSDVDEFLSERDAALEKIKQCAGSDSYPRILLGAEVAYFMGISNMQELYKLKIEGTDLLLLEMPSEKWSKYMIEELLTLASREDMTVLLAHTERYFEHVRESVWKKLSAAGILMQSNIRFFASARTRKKAFRWLKKGRVDLFGSDCHDTNYRPPMFDVGLAVIREELGESFIEKTLLCEKKFIQ